MAVITKQDLENARLDAQSLADVVNGAFDENGDGTVTTRLGIIIKTLARVMLDIGISGTLYADTTSGLAGTSEGEYFSVVSPNSDEFISLYQNLSGVATLLKTYPSTEFLDFISKASVFGYAWNVQDEFGRIALGVKDDGGVVAKSFNGLTYTENLPNSYAWGLQDEFGRIVLGVRDDGTVVIGDLKVAGSFFESKLIEGASGDGYSYVIQDDSGKIAFGIQDDGTVVIGTAVISELNQQLNSILVYRSGGVYSNQLNFINNTGQSLGEGSTPADAITTTQEYDNIGFPARSVSPPLFVPLTVAETQVGSRGESPMYGTLGHIKELILEENNLQYQDNDYQLAACNNSYGGYSITELNKGTTPYNNAITQIQSLMDISEIQGKTATFQAVTWTQGEADAVTNPPMDIDVYRDHLVQLITDYNSDGKAITNQSNDVKLICYQMCSRSRNIALAQLEASNQSPLIFMATPTYIFDFADDVHIDAPSSKWMGGYYGLVYKRVVVDKQDWKPLQPIAHNTLGSTVDLMFNKSGLNLDTTLVPAQTNFGFDVVDELDNPQTISNVEVISPNRVRITLSSGSFSTGWRVRYGFQNATGKGSFVGGCGNLRDNQGDTIIYSAVNKPMHNWCVIFSYTI